MKWIIFLFSISLSLDSIAQETDSNYSIEVGISVNRFEYGEKGFAITNGLTFRLGQSFSIAPNLQFAYGFYRYYQNQIEPSFVEARYFSFRLPVQWMAPGKFDFLKIGLGPSLTFRSRVENTNFKNDTIIGTTRFYKYDSGYMYNTLYAGMTGLVEARIYKSGRFSVNLFAEFNAYFNPFKLDYYGGGIKTYVNL